MIAPTLDPSAASGNGVNPVDVGIKTATSPIVGSAGALLFGTNVGLAAQLGSSAIVVPSAVDVASVSLSGGHIEAQIDGDAYGQPTARVNYLNIYNVTSSVAAQVHNVLAGTLTLDVDGSRIDGQIDLQGSSGFGGPQVSSYYRASVSGTRSG